MALLCSDGMSTCDEDYPVLEFLDFQDRPEIRQSAVQPLL